jgi:4-hydroxy-tetrahydrodipicolinate synthase
MTALITPFKNGEVDEVKYKELIERQIRLGIDWVVPVGTTGESATLSHEEHQRCIEIAVDTVKGTDVKVLAGAGSNSTKEAIGLAKFAQKVGADAILTVAPYYNKPSQEGLYLHYKAVANSIDIPVMLYNVPSRTGVDLLPETVARLTDRVENIFSIKEATGSLERVVSLLNSSPELDIISGDDGINAPIILAGGKGVISVTANILPNKISELVKYAMAKDVEKANQINQELYHLNNNLFIEANPIPIKAAMYIAGVLDTLEYRLPLTPPSLENMKTLEKVLEKYEVLK